MEAVRINKNSLLQKKARDRPGVDGGSITVLLCQVTLDRDECIVGQHEE
jgi:hypothetical protein